MTITGNWRQIAYSISLGTVLLNPVYFLVATTIIRHFFHSDKAFGYMVTCGFLLGIFSTILGIVGFGKGRWLLVLIGIIETAWWMLMAVGA
jgi:hypothetical protein